MLPILYFVNITLAEACCTTMLQQTPLNSVFSTNCTQCAPTTHWPPELSKTLFSAYTSASANKPIRVVRLTDALPLVIDNHLAALFKLLAHRQTLVVPNTCAVTKETIDAWTASPFFRAAAILKNTKHTYHSAKSYSYLALHGISLFLGFLCGRAFKASRRAPALTG